MADHTEIPASTPLRSAKPTFELIKAIAAVARARYTERDTAAKRVDDIYNDKHRLNIPEDTPHKPHPVRLGIASDAVDRIAAMFSQPPILSVPHETLAPAEAERSLRLELGLRALFPLLEEEAGGNQWNLGKHDLCKLGWGCIGILPVRQNWSQKAGYPVLDVTSGEKPDGYTKRVDAFKRGSRLPFVMRYFPALGSYRIKGATGVEHVVIIEERTNEDILSDPAFDVSAFRERIGTSTSTRLESKTEVILWANQEWCAYATPNEMLGPPMRHGLGQPPFEFGHGFLVNGKDPAYDHGIGVLHQVADLLVEQDSLNTRMASWTNAWAFHPGVMTVSDNEQLRPRIANKVQLPPFNYKDVIPLYPGEAFNPDGAVPKESRLVNEQFARNFALIDRKLLSSVLTGEAPGGVTAGFSINSLIRAATTKYRMLGDNLADWRRRLAILILRHIEVLKEDLWFYWKRGKYDSTSFETGWYKIANDDIRGNLRIEAKIKPILPIDVAANMDLAMRSQQIGWMEPRDAMEFWMDMEDADVFVSRARIWQYLQAPEMRQVTILKLLERAQVEIGEGEQTGLPEPDEVQRLPDAFFLAAQSAQGAANGRAATMEGTVPQGYQATVRKRGRPAGADRRPGNQPPQEAGTAMMVRG